MNKTNKLVTSLLFIIMLVAILIATTGKTFELNAKEKNVTSRAAEVPTPWLNDINAQSGKLQFGLTNTAPLRENLSPGFGGLVNSVPNVMYVESEDKTVRHIFDYRKFDHNGEDGGGTERHVTSTTAAFNIIETEAEYQRGSKPHSPAGVVAFLDAIKTPGVTEKKDEITATGNKLTDKDLEISLTMQGNENQSAVSHLYTITNSSTTETKTIYPMKHVDTMLNYDDWVPIYSRGKGAGLYIQGRDQEKRPGEKRYRLDYVMDFENDDPDNIHAPLYYQGGYHSSDFATIFGDMSMLPIQASPDVAKTMEADTDQLIYGTEDENDPNLINFDTAIFMSWGKVTLIPGATYKMRYDVGIKPMASLEMTKTHENLTRDDGTYQVGDDIEYTISMTSPKDGYEDVTIKDLIPRGFEEPDPTSDITFTHTAGPIAPVKMADAYTKNDDVNVNGIGTIKLPVSGDGYDFAAEDTMTIKFTVKLSADAAGMKEIKNMALVSGTSEGGSTFTDDPVIDEVGFDVDDAGPITVKYVDLDGKPLPNVADLTVTGKLGEKKKISTELNGYAFDHASGPLEMTITTANQEITLYYKENRFTIKQEAVIAGNVSATAVKAEEQIDYTVTVESHLKAGQTYKDFVINGKISGVINGVKEFKIASSVNPTVPLSTPVEYDSTTGVIKATVIPSDNVPSEANLILTYTGKVNADVEPLDKITAEARASGDYSDGMSAKEVKASDFVSTVSAGKLSFVSAPAMMSFGEQLNMSLVDKSYPLVSKDASLAVKDLRGTNNQWVMVVKVTEELTSSAKGHPKLPNALTYTKEGINNVLALGQDFIVTTHTTTSTDLVDISQTWHQPDNQPLVKVKAGEAVVGTYTGKVKWSLRDGL